MGRPPTINLTYADCEFPTDEEQTINEDGEIIPGCKFFCDIATFDS